MTTEKIQTLPVNEKEKVFIQMYKNGFTNLQAVARHLLVSIDLVKKWRVLHYPNFGKVAKKKRSPQKSVIPANIEKLEKFKELYPSGKYTLSRIAEILGISSGTVGRWKKAFFSDQKFRAFTRLHYLPLVDQFKKLYESRKYTDLEICEKLGISRGALHRWKKQFYPEGKKWKYNQFVRFYKSGYSLETCCFFLRITRTTALRYLKKYNSTQAETAQNATDSTTANFASGADGPTISNNQSRKKSEKGKV